MAEFDKIKLGVTPYDVKDTTARNSITSLTSTFNSLYRLYGKKIAVFGSSNDGPLGDYQWPYLLQNMLSGIATVEMHSVSGEILPDTIDRFISDFSDNDFDIILFTSLRNAFKIQYNLISTGFARPVGHAIIPDNVNSIASKIKLLKTYIKTSQEVYFASCLPYNYSFAGATSMSIYDAVVYRCCNLLGFKYLDMHSWIPGCIDSNSVSYTIDGVHFTTEAQNEIAKSALNALLKGGETLKYYICTGIPAWYSLDNVVFNMTVGSDFYWTLSLNLDSADTPVTISDFISPLSTGYTNSQQARFTYEYIYIPNIPLSATQSQMTLATSGTIRIDSGNSVILNTNLTCILFADHMFFSNFTF